MAKVSIVILNYKLKDQTIKCVESVKGSTFKDLQIYVVDNNSQDGIEDELEVYPEIKFIKNSDNLGYAGGNNSGIKEALKDGAEFVFILNPDTTIKNDAIDILYKKAQEYSAQILSPKIYFMDSKKIWFAGKVFDFANVLGSHRGVDEEDKGQFDKDEEMEDTTGAAMFVAREIFEKVGLFDERFFLYYEESDFCFRAKKMGFKIMYIPEAVVYHKNAQTTGLGSPLQDYFITRNRMLFAKNNLPFRTQFALLREGLRNLGNPVRRMAFFDYLSGNFGKGSFLK